MKRTLFMLMLAFMVALIPLAKAENWSGADEKAEEAIKQLSPDYEPWFSQIWEPPSGEIESLLFSVQAGIGAFVVGYVIGRHGAGKDARNA